MGTQPDLIQHVLGKIPRKQGRLDAILAHDIGEEMLEAVEHKHALATVGNLLQVYNDGALYPTPPPPISLRSVRDAVIKERINFDWLGHRSSPVFIGPTISLLVSRQAGPYEAR